MTKTADASVSKPGAVGVEKSSGDSALSSTEEFHQWWSERHRNRWLKVTRVPFAEVDSWSFDEKTGNLGHESGRFFTIEGLQVRVGSDILRSQPIIYQPEIGVLGIVVTELDGVLHCLMQAKMEPGNVNTLQLSPTVQATRSNYTQVHRGRKTRYLEYFIGPDRGEVLVDVLQSEQGGWFWRKRNRNIVVKVSGPVPLHDDFRWIPLSVVRALMKEDNLVNMDARTVLSCMPFTEPDGPVRTPDTGFAHALRRSYRYENARKGSSSALHSLEKVLSWFTEAKTWCDWHARLVPLDEVVNWTRTADEITQAEAQDFRIIGIRVAGANREVTGWAQPVLEPFGQGTAILVARMINGVLHLLVKACPEFGLLDLVEIGPTVQLLPGQDAAAVGDPLLKEVATGGLGRVHYDAVLSEEGGRFYHALTRYSIVEVGDEFPIDVPANFCWMTMRQLMGLLRHGHYVNIEARTLLTCMQSLW